MLSSPPADADGFDTGRVKLPTTPVAAFTGEPGAVPRDGKPAGGGWALNPEEAVERAVRNARPHRSQDAPRWVAGMHVFGCGSTVARELCARYGLEPDTTVKGINPESAKAPPRVRITQWDAGWLVIRFTGRELAYKSTRDEAEQWCRANGYHEYEE